MEYRCNLFPLHFLLYASTKGQVSNSYESGDLREPTASGRADILLGRLVRMLLGYLN